MPTAGSQARHNLQAWRGGTPASVPSAEHDDCLCCYLQAHSRDTEGGEKTGLEMTKVSPVPAQCKDSNSLKCAKRVN